MTLQPSRATSLSSGRHQAGTGAIALSGDLLAVHYIGWLYDPLRIERKGGVFDTSRNGSPFVFTLGAEEVIPGWESGWSG